MRGAGPAWNSDGNSTALLPAKSAPRGSRRTTLPGLPCCGYGYGYGYGLALGLGLGLGLGALPIAL